MRPPDGLARLARLHGIETEYRDAFGQTTVVPEDSLRALLQALGCAVAGERQIRASLAAAEAALAPPQQPARRRTRCFTMDDLGDDPGDDPGRERLWGVAAQLYGLRSRRNWGIGDFTDLGALAEISAAKGAATLGINPLHALFPTRPDRRSPYSPSSRQFLNTLYIDPEAVPDLAASAAAQGVMADAAFRARLTDVRGAELVDYAAVADLKRQVLAPLFETFAAQELAQDSARAQAFRAFVAAGGEALARFACFEALQEAMAARGITGPWQSWPGDLADPASAEVRSFAAAHADRITFFQYLQWVADEQLAAGQARARAAGMPIGLYRDLAVGVDPTGAAAWAHQDVVVTGVAVGAPPDPFNALGQDWGLAPFSPVGLAAQDYRLLGDDLRSNMRHAGAVRIDHVMALRRLFWIPEGASPAAGAYVGYPLHAMLDVVAACSQAERCLVIGEDLGTVPPGFRRTMAAAGLMSYRLFYFERRKTGGLKPPASYPRNALVSVSTHDLPTLRGYWAGRDLAWRDRLDLHPDPAAREAAQAQRSADRRAIERALVRAGLMQPGALAAADDAALDRLVVAVHRYLAATPSRLMMLQLEDALGEVEQANLPGTIDAHPNWRRRLALALEGLAGDPGFSALAEALNGSGRANDPRT